LAELASELVAGRQTDAEAVASDIRPGMEELAVLGLVEPVF
jgi:hypothetical protein